MKVSIIIPAFDVERYIGRCLDSAINQTLDSSQYEIIIINDHSNDHTLNVVKRYYNKFTNLILINNLKTLGPGISRNVGLKVSKGKYIFFLDSDDYIHKNTLKILYTKGVKHKADVVGYNFKKIINNNKQILKCRIDINKIQDSRNEIIKNFLYGEMDGSVIFSFIKRDMIYKNNIKFKEGLHEDILFIFKVYFFSSKIIKYDKDLYFKKNRSTSITNNLSPTRILDLLEAFKDVYKFLNKKNKNLAKKYFQFYIRGLVGCVGTFLIENFKYCKKSRHQRYKNYFIIYKSIKNDFKKVLFSEISFKDKITKIYLEEFKKTPNFIKASINYEKKYKKLN